MGYDYYASNELHIEPVGRLGRDTWDRLAYPGRLDDYLHFAEAGEEDTVGWVDGEIKVIPGAKHIVVTCAHDDAFRDLEAFLNEIKEMVKEVGPEAKITGYIRISGEETGDVSRVRVDATTGLVIHEQAALRWPDGTIEPL